MLLPIPDILLAITAISNLGLMWFVQQRDRDKPVNRLFALFVASIAFWAIVILLFRVTASVPFALYLMKFSYVIALLLAFFFYRFSLLFPNVETLDKTTRLIIATGVTAVVVFLLLPGTLTRAIVSHDWGKEVILEPYAYGVFAASFLSLFISAQVRLFKKAWFASGTERSQLLIIAGSVTIVGLFGMYYNLLLPSPMFQNFRYIWSGPVFTFVFAVIITYSIFRFRLFNPRAILAELFVYVLVLFLFVRLILTDSQKELFINGSLLVAVSLVGWLVIKGVTKEVEQRELIEIQEKELEKSNQQQKTLLHFISHEVKGYLTKGQNAFAGIVEGDYGKPTPGIDAISSGALKEMRAGVDTVMGILEASNLKKGTVAFAKAPFDLKDAVMSVADDLRASAEDKHLSFEVEISPSGTYGLIGDAEKIKKHVVRNLIDNSIRYTPQGSIRVSVMATQGRITFSVRDTGVGITPEDMKRLFTEGGHGEDSLKVNVDSTGYGLYIAKQIVEAHGGTIRAESEGQGKGSAFIVEFPSGSSQPHAAESDHDKIAEQVIPEQDA